MEDRGRTKVKSDEMKKRKMSTSRGGAETYRY